MRVGNGQGVKQDSVNETKDGDVRADSEGKSKHRDGGEAGIRAEHAGGRASVMPRRFDEGFPAGGADDHSYSWRKATSGSTRIA